MLAFKPALDVVTSRKRQTEGLPAEQKGQDRETRCKKCLQRMSQWWVAHKCRCFGWIFPCKEMCWCAIFSTFMVISPFFGWILLGWMPCASQKTSAARRRNCRWWFPSVCKICWRYFLQGWAAISTVVADAVFSSWIARPMKGAKPDVDYLLTVLQTVSIPPVPVPWHAWGASLERCKWSITKIALKRDSGLFKNSMPSTTLEWKVPR